MVLAFITPEMVPLIAGGGATVILSAPVYYVTREFRRIRQTKRDADSSERLKKVKELEAEWEKHHAFWRNWLLSVVEGTQKETRADTIRKFYEFGTLTLASPSALRKYGQEVEVVAGFSSYVRRDGQMEEYRGSTWSHAAHDNSSSILNNESDWEAFARLVEVIPDDHLVHRSVDKYLKHFAANLVLNYAPEPTGSWDLTAEEVRDATARQRELDALLTALLKHKLVGWKQRSLAPRKDPVEAALAVKSTTPTKALEAAVEDKAAEREASQDPQWDNLTEQEGVVVTAYTSAASGMPEERQREGDKYLERLREAVDAEVRAEGFAEEYRSQIVAVSQENRAIATQGLESLTRRYGATEEPELLRSLRVSNKYLLAKTSEETDQNLLATSTTSKMES